MKRIISLCLVLLIGAGLFSCTSQPAPAPTPAKTGSSVWKVSKNGNTLYLGGSIHILRETDYPLPNQFDEAFSRSAVLVLETDLEQLSNESVAEYLMYQMILPYGQTLRSVLDSGTYELLEAAFYEYGFAIDGSANIKPSMVINILTMLQVQKYGFLQEGVDMYYLEKARNEKKAVDYLESIESQIDLLVTMGDGYEDEYVLYSLQDMSSTESDLMDLVYEWKNGESSILEGSLIEMREEWPDIYKAMITNRNAAWMPQIEKFLASGTVYFVIAGLAHMHGPDGLLKQLEDSGCVIEYL